MTASRPLLRHFLGSLIGRGVLQDDGVEAVRGLLFSLVAGLFSVGVMLPRQFSRIYLELSYLPDPGPFRRAMVADGLFMLTVPFFVALVIAALVAPSMFPDEVDYLTLVPLPITRRRIFAAKLGALAIFVGVLLASLSVLAAISFPMFTNRRWAEGHILARIGSHAAGAAASAAFGFLCVVALQGLGSVWAPRRWLPRLAVLVPCGVISFVILATPFVLQLPAERMWVATHPAILAWFPPAWFTGLERVLLGVADPYWQRLAIIGGVVTAVVTAVAAVAYSVLYRRFERLVLPSPREVLGAGAAKAGAGMTNGAMNVWTFSRATLVRNRLPLLLFLIFVAVGFGVVTRHLLNGFLDDTFVPDEPAPGALLSGAITMPLVLMLTGLTGLRTAFMLPVQSRANWIFRVTDAPRSRAVHLAAVDRACLRLVIIPALLMSAPIQIWVLGTAAWKTLGLAALAGLAMTEIALAGWRRVPFTCTWIPGKRPLVFTVLGAAALYFVVATVLATLIELSLFSWPLLTWLSGIMLAVGAGIRHTRVTSWAERPLLFEDEPFQLQVLGLR
jgi:hypothetical protein